MPKQSFALEPGAEKRLVVSWRGIWKDVTVTFDGQSIGVIPDQKALSAGREFRLPDGSTLKVQLARKYTAVELQVLRNGQPLPGSASDPETRLKSAYFIIYFLAGLNLALGLWSWLFNVGFLQELGVGIGSVIFGLIFLALGFFVQRRSGAALILAIVLLALDGILGFALAVSQGYNPGIGGLLFRIAMLIPMVQGVGAIRALKAGSA